MDNLRTVISKEGNKAFNISRKTPKIISQADFFFIDNIRTTKLLLLKLIIPILQIYFLSKNYLLVFDANQEFFKHRLMWNLDQDS